MLIGQHLPYHFGSTAFGLVLHPYFISKDAVGKITERHKQQPLLLLFFGLRPVKYSQIVGPLCLVLINFEIPTQDDWKSFRPRESGKIDWFSLHSFLFGKKCAAAWSQQLFICTGCSFIKRFCWTKCVTVMSNAVACWTLLTAWQDCSYFICRKSATEPLQLSWMGSMGPWGMHNEIV